MAGSSPSSSPPLPPGKSSKRFNPFSSSSSSSRGERNNFPGLESAFTSPNDDNESECETSFLNLSIGAFASLAEHMRHVAKYGIDNDDNEFAPVQEEEEVDFTASERNPLDDQWDYFLDHSNFNVDESFAALHQSVDTSFADTSDDFFNSSHVQYLHTPERNQNIETRIWKRGEEQFFDQSYDEEQDLEPGATAPPELVAAAAARGDEDFFPVEDSVHAINISRISDAESDFLAAKRTPNQSFQDQLLDESLNFLDVSSSMIHDSSFSSTPMRHPPRSRNSTPRIGSGKKSRLPSRQTFQQQKENILSKLANSTSPLKERLDRSFERRKSSPLAALENLPRDFMKALGGGRRMSPPSPITSKRSTPSPHTSLTGRRKYRTVVPRRVFLESSSPHQMFEGQDSFSVPSRDYEDEYESQNAHPSPLKKSLTESFENAFQGAPLFGSSSS
jgi:hypothetical protein